MQDFKLPLTLVGYTWDADQNCAVGRQIFISK